MRGGGELAGKVALITGATSGIGKETAKALRAKGARVVALGRDVCKLADVSAELGVERLQCDLASLRDVRRAAAELRARFGRLDVLVNNAGAIYGQREVTREGFERTFAVNHLAHFVLTHELLDLLRAAAPSRIVHVSSAAAIGARLDLDDLQLEQKWQSVVAYCNAKLLNQLFAFELARRLDGSGVTSNALHPGAIASNFGNGAGWFGTLTKLVRPLLLSSEKGARTSIWAASAPELRDMTGRYFVRQRERTPPRLARDAGLARRVWDASASLAARAA